jgi:hypothetical protein
MLDNTYVPHVAASDAYDLGALARGCDILGRGLRLLYIAADDAGVRAQVYEGSGLRTADGASASGDECDPTS